MKFLINENIKRPLIFIILFAVFLFSASILKNIAYSDEYDDLSKKIADLQSALQQSQNATKPLQTQLTSLKSQLAAIDAQVAQIEQDLIIKKKNIDDGYKKLEDKQKLFNVTVKNSYIKTYTFSPLLIFLSGNNISDITSMITYQKRNTEQDKNIITNIALQLVELEQKKKELESEQAQLAAAKIALDKDRVAVQKVVDGAVAYQNTLTGQIAELSAKQQQLLAQKLGSLNIPLFAYNTQGGCSSDIDPYKDPGFSGDKFALFTYGVPNRVGLNQYGAWGRAKAGKGYDDILHAYYNFDGYQDMDATIKVNDSNGYDSGNIIWTGSLEDYVKRIYEVPDSWTDNDLAALKAQTIAARSYVLAETDNGNKSICANQNCQVFKTDPKGGNWDTATNATQKKVMVQGGKPIAAYFSSTHGGYVFSTSDIGWRGTSFTKRAQDSNGDINSFSDLQSKAYDKDSPWFYCDWGGRSQYNKTAWLTSSEMADIVNSILLVQSDNSTDSHILQTDKSDSETWNEDKVRQELSKYRTPFSSISSGSVDVDFGSGRTTQVHFAGSAGSVSFDGTVFKKYFNLRAPSNINIVGPLFNIEKK